jgi:hypothetical protein
MLVMTADMSTADDWSRRQQALWGSKNLNRW